MQSDWSPVALAADVPPGIVIPARLPEIELAIWRSASGRLAAWVDRCPHRGMRLSHGFVRGEMLSCLYHGWRFDAEGQCRKIPAHPELVPPEAICTTRYACVEQSGLVWVSLQATDSSPPALPAGQPLCSLAVQVPPDTVAAAVGLASRTGSVSLPGCELPILLALQARPDGCTVHALLADNDGGVANLGNGQQDISAMHTALSALEHLQRVLESGTHASTQASRQASTQASSKETAAS